MPHITSDPVLLLGKTVEIQEGIWIKANFVEERTDKGKTHNDGSISFDFNYLVFSKEGYGWYRYYEGDRIK